MKVKDLKAAEYQARTITDLQLAMLGKSMQNYGDLSGVIFNTRTKRLIGGHQRLKHLDPEWEIVKRSCKDKLGTTAAGFIRTPFGRWIYREVNWPERKEMMASIAANKQGGEFDNLKLKNLVISLDDGKLDTDLLGFDADEMIDLRGLKQGQTDPDAVPPLPKKPKTKKGDMYILGGHRLLCGDTCKKEDVNKLMSNKNAKMLFTDPPYNVNYGSSMRDNIRKTNAKKIMNDNFKSSREFSKFLTDFITSVRPRLSGDVYICMSSSELLNLYKTFIGLNGHFSSFIIWVKNHFTLTRSNYQRQFEPILYGWFIKSSFWSSRRNLSDVYKDVDIKYDTDGTPLVRMEPGGIESNIWEFKKPVSNKLHPTMKPVDLCIRGIINSSMAGDICLDTFLGSGSTLIACEMIDRICYGMELDPSYCDVIVERWENFTGQKAKLIKK